MRQIFSIVAVLILSLLIMLFVIPLLWPWTPLNCSHDDIDITAGRYRNQRYLLWIKVSETVEETALSKLYEEFVGPLPSPQWRRVNTFSPGTSNSPHYAYHQALYTTSWLANLLCHSDLSSEDKKNAILDFFHSLQKDGNCSRAQEYVMSNFGLSNTSKQISPTSLPDTPTVSDKHQDAD